MKNGIKSNGIILQFLNDAHSQHINKLVLVLKMDKQIGRQSSSRSSGILEFRARGMGHAEFIILISPRLLFLVYLNQYIYEHKYRE